MTAVDGGILGLGPKKQYATAGLLLAKNHEDYINSTVCINYITVP